MSQIDETYAKTHMGVKPGEFVMIAVSDTGHGMDSATRQNIFEPFFTTKQRGKGTGLGLATVYGMVKQSGGDIWVYSEPGQGTTFKLYFPRVAEPVSPGWSEEVEHPRHVGGETVMLVEDEAQVRDLEARMLKQLGYTVLAASNGEEAIDVSHAHPGEISPAGDGRGDAEHERQAGGGCPALYAGRISRSYTCPVIPRTPWSIMACWIRTWTFLPSLSAVKLSRVRSTKSCRGKSFIQS